MSESATLASPFGWMQSSWRYRELLWQLTRRDVLGRYRGSALGLFWSFLTPLFMLAVYTFIFSVVFTTRVGHTTTSRVDFAITLFAGLLVHSLFAESVNRAPTLILSHANYVKKVVFPLEVLPLTVLATALFHALVGVAVLLIFQLLANHRLPFTALAIPLVFVPLGLYLYGFVGFLAATGVYLRDISHPIAVTTTALLFLSPVFYPVSALPAPIQPFVYVNPLTFAIQQTRAMLIHGGMPGLIGWLVYTACGVAVATGGYWWFQKTRRGFADVL